VYPVEWGVDGFFECPPAVLASETLDAKMTPVPVEYGAAAPWAGKTGELGGEGEELRLYHLGCVRCVIIHRNVGYM